MSMATACSANTRTAWLRGAFAPSREHIYLMTMYHQIAAPAPRPGTPAAAPAVAIVEAWAGLGAEQLG